MTLTLDPQLEQRIQREIELGAGGPLVATLLWVAPFIAPLSYAMSGPSAGGPHIPSLFKTGCPIHRAFVSSDEWAIAKRSVVPNPVRRTSQTLNRPPPRVPHVSHLRRGFPQRYTSPTTLTLDPQLEQRIQREIELGHGRTAAEVIHRALDHMTADESWSEEEEAELDARFDRSMAAFDRGEGISGHTVRELLAQRRAARLG